jgi:alkylation response protein AidB-like acyl-CoA dehydrogenase
MTGNAPMLGEVQSDLVAMLDSLMSDREVMLSDERPDEVAAVRRQLAELGVWTLGVPEALGGGGADELLTTTVFSRLAHRWAALSWAAVQAHAAIELLGADERWAELVTDVHAGKVAVAVVEPGQPIRVDAAGEQPHVLVLEGESTIHVYSPESLTYQPLRRTGLGGALTGFVHTATSPVVLGDADVAAARVRLRLGAAAVAAGIADAAATAALAYSSSRHQFGAPLTALPTVREQLFGSSGAAVVMLRQVFRSADATPWQAAAVLDAACESAIDACAGAVQSHGGYGYLTEYPVERLLRDALSLRAACDTAAIRQAGALELATPETLSQCARARTSSQS